MKMLPLLVLVSALSLASFPQNSPAPAPPVCPECIRAHMDFLASDMLRGRACGTEEENISATYLASELEQYGVTPGATPKDFLQKVELVKNELAAPPKLTFNAAGDAAETTWAHGKEMIVAYSSGENASGPLQRIDVSKPGTLQHALPGAVVFYMPKNVEDLGEIFARIPQFIREGAVAILLPPRKNTLQNWEKLGAELPQLRTEVVGAPSSDMGVPRDVIRLSEAAVQKLMSIPEGTPVRIQNEKKPGVHIPAYNVIGMLHGSAPNADANVVLLTAHYDHLGVGAPVNGDNIYNGADDDASGTTAVLELARTLAAARPQRTVYFTLFSCEEAGGLGATYFRAHPPVPLTDIIANIEFEMIGRADPKIKPDELWLSGWERSNLGPTLAAHGAHLVGDPHPEQHFFERSDNYVLARGGVVAQTVSSYGLHADYHQPSDDLGHIDWKHMEDAIGSMLGPIEWLVNSDFKPAWNPNGRP
jgi:peptidase M28-like protein